MFGASSQIGSTRPAQLRTRNNYAPIIRGPISPDPQVARSARNESMAKAAMGGDMRAYSNQAGKGVRAGSNMSAYRAGLLSDAEYGKNAAQAQQDLLNGLTAQANAEQQYQQRLSGELGWMRDLLLDREDVRMRERMSAYKRFVDRDVNDYDQTMLDAQQKWDNEARITEALV